MRIFVLEQNEAALEPGACFQPETERCRYLTQVLRIEEGSLLPAQGPDGTRRVLRLEASRPCSLRILDPTEFSSRELQEIFRELPDPQTQNKGEVKLILLPSLLKGKKTEQIIRQAVEIGASAILPIIAERSVPRYKPAEAQKKQQRWQAIIREAVQQSGAPELPKIAPPAPLKEQIQRLEEIEQRTAQKHLRLVFHERPLEQQSIHGYLSDQPGIISCAIGPEGGFCDSELEQFTKSGFRPALLPGNILRAETAAICALSVIRTIRAEERAWRNKR